MIKRIINALKMKKDYMETKRTLSLLALNKYSELLTAQLEKEQEEKAAYESARKMNESFSAEDVKEFIRVLTDFTSKINQK